MSIQDPVHFKFRERTDIRPLRRRSSSWSAGWLLLAFVGAVAFVLLVRAMLERSAHTAGPSEAAVAAVRSDAELKAELAADLQSAARVASDQPADSTYVQPVRPEVGSLVYRCVGRNGAVSFQQQPCAADQDLTRVLHAPPDRRPARPMQLHRLPEAERRAAGSAYSTGSPESDRDRRKRNCAIARQHRENTLKAVGLARTYDLLQKLDAQVYEACKGL